jgi:hypothetical protein
MTAFNVYQTSIVANISNMLWALICFIGIEIFFIASCLFSYSFIKKKHNLEDEL